MTFQSKAIGGLRGGDKKSRLPELKLAFRLHFRENY